MGLFSQLRPLATYTNATTDFIEVPAGGKVRAGRGDMAVGCNASRNRIEL